MLVPESDTIMRCSLVAIGVALLQEVYHCRCEFCQSFVCLWNKM